MTECNQSEFGFEASGRREVVARFDGGTISSDGGAFLLRQTDQRLNLLPRLAQCFLDGRNQDLVEHSILEMLSQRIYGLALGYEDLNDHEQLRQDPVFGILAGREELDEPLAGKSTLNRMELGAGTADRYKKITFWKEGMDELLVQVFLESHRSAPGEIVRDVDTTDLPLHGKQEGRFFHGYYDNYCYLPLYVFCGTHVLVSRMRRSNIDGSAGALEEIVRIVRQIRTRWPPVRIVLRADSGFAREALMAWCEANRVDYVFGLARNERLEARVAEAMGEAERLSGADAGRPARVFRDFEWTTKDSWSRRRRVIGKAEWTGGEANPRFVVTSFKADSWRAKPLYEKLYCARGEMENRIKECQGDLFADRTSTATLRANQLRLWLAATAYALLCALRRIGLAHTAFASATCGTIRLKLLKLGALVKISAMRVRIAFASACPNAQEWRLAAARLASARASPT